MDRSIWAAGWVMVAVVLGSWSMVLAEEAPFVPASQATLPKSLQVLSDAAGLTVEEAGALAAALQAFEQGRGAAEKAVADAQAAWKAANEAVPADPAAIEKASEAVRAARETRKVFHATQAVDLAKMMPAEKYVLWVAADAHRMVSQALARLEVKLDADQSARLVEMCKAMSPRLIAEGSAGTKAGRALLVNEAMKTLLTDDQRAAVAALEEARRAAAQSATTTQPAAP